MKIKLIVLSSVFLAGTAMAQESFKTPSNNIACALYDNVLRCDMKENTAKLPPRPTDCDLDWGNAFEMGVKGRASRACVGDTVWGANDPVLEYGKNWEKAGFRCTSEPTGLTCQNQERHGWMLKRAEQKLF
jgi:hypothetical protein